MLLYRLLVGDVSSRGAGCQLPNGCTFGTMPDGVGSACTPRSATCLRFNNVTPSLISKQVVALAHGRAAELIRFSSVEFFLFLLMGFYIL